MELTWSQVETLTDKLSERVKDSNFSPNYLVAVARGGFVPARLLSTRLSIKRLGSVGIAYTGPDRTDRQIYGSPQLLQRSDRILLVEDALESGRSLADCRMLLEDSGATVKTVCYFYRQNAVVVPDYSLGSTTSIPRFPWE